MAGKREAQLRSLAREKAQMFGVDPDLFEAIIAVESGFDPEARSQVGAQGLVQMMPETARDLGFIGTDKTLRNPEINLELGSRYLSELLKRFGGDWELAAAAYNAGPGAVQKYGGVPPFGETQNYVTKLNALYTPPPPPPKMPENIPEASMMRPMKMPQAPVSFWDAMKGMMSGR